MRTTLRLSGLLATFAVIAPAQNLIVDGSLEGHTSSGCNYNQTNAAFNGFYTNATSFGAAGGIDIMQGACFGNPAPAGATRVSLAWNNAPGGNLDAMSLDLTAPLTPGVTYCLSFQAEDMPFGTPQPFEIGLSTSPTSFGTLIYTDTATVMSWTLFSTAFVAPLAATHLTVQCPQGFDMWVAFDDFNLHAGNATATNTNFGVACHGPALAALTRPVIGTNWDLDLNGIPGGALLGFMQLGLSNPNTPLGSFGAPQCTQYTDGIASILVLLPVTHPTTSLSIPLHCSFVGLPLHAQGGAFVPGVNALGLAASGGVLGTVGDV